MSVHQLDEPALRRLVRLCVALVGPSAADDLAQDTLVAALRSRRPPATRDALDAWLAGVARNVARRHWRRQATEITLTHGEFEIPEPTDAVDDTVERREHLARRALERLPAPTRSLLTARDVAGHGTGELARQLGLSPAAASMRLTRARLALRRIVTDQLGEEARSAGIRTALPGWRPTTLWCSECGDRRLEARRTHDHLAFRCPSCAPHPAAFGSGFRLGNPTFASLLGGIVQPSAIARRAAAWSHDYFIRASGSRQAPCTACGRLVSVHPYRRSIPGLALRHRLGLQASCAACGETVSSSVGGLAASLPESRQLQARAGRVRSTEAIPTRVDGRAALVVGQRAMQGGGAVEMVVDAETLRPIHVRTTR